MVVLNALRRTPGALRRNPAVFVPVLLVVLLQIPQLVLQSVDPLLASVVSIGLSLVLLVVTPFFQGGLLAMADQALDGRTSLSTFVDAGKRNYVSMLIAYLLVVGVNFVLGFVVAMIALFGGVALLAGERGALGMVGIVAIAGVGLLVLLAYLLFVFFVQFYGQAIVVDGLGAVEGLKRSVSVVRHNLLSALGYTLLVGVIGGLIGAGLGALSVLSSASRAGIALPEPSLGVVAGLGVVALAVGTLLGGFLTVFSVAFYRNVR